MITEIVEGQVVLGALQRSCCCEIHEIIGRCSGCVRDRRKMGELLIEVESQRSSTWRQSLAIEVGHNDQG